jgi:glycosyltransferase involved in cell wall biosynthesis
MKVLHVIPCISERSGGPGQAILPMCRALHDQGVDVLLATTDDDLPASNKTNELSRNNKTTYKELPVIFFPKQLGASFKYSRPFSQWLEQNVSNYDVVHIHAVFNHACIAAARACLKHGVPYLIRPLGSLDPWSMKQKSLRKKVFWHGGIKKILTNAAAIHYTSNAEQQAVEESLGLNHGVVIPLGVNVTRKDDFAVVNDLPEQFSFLSTCSYVLVLSRLLPTKGLDVLLNAFLSLVKRQEFHTWRLVLAGDGPADYVESLKRTVERHHATKSVVFPGWLDGAKKAAALGNASLLALPSHHENFGLCVMESLVCGVPVLISPHVNLAPEIQAARAGWIAAVDKNSLEAALTDALSSEHERFQRGKNGQELARRYTWPTVAAKLAELYCDIVSRNLGGKSRVSLHA